MKRCSATSPTQKKPNSERMPEPNLAITPNKLATRPRIAAPASNPAYLENAEKEVTIREGDETRRVAAYIAAVQAHPQAAAGGKPKTQKDYLGRVDEAQGKKKCLNRGRASILAHIKAVQQDQINAAQAKGEPTELILNTLERLHSDWLGNIDAAALPQAHLLSTWES
jgi:hypothetical protein